MSASSDGNEKIGVGIVGTGMIAHAHALACKGNPHTQIVALADIRQQALDRFTERYELAVPAVADYRELLQVDGLDAVIVATPNDSHAPICRDAAAAGKNVLCEKPMATSLDEAKAMVRAVEEAGVTAMMGYCKRFYPGSLFLRDHLREEELGLIYHVRASYYQSWLADPKIPAVWRLQQVYTGTGVLGDLGSHITDLAQFLMAEPIDRVTGVLKTFVPERPTLGDRERMTGVDVDDACLFAAEFRGGALGLFEASRNATGHGDHWRFEINAEKGGIVYDNVDGRVLRSTGDGTTRNSEWEEVPIPASYGADGGEFQREVDHWIDCIRSGSQPVPDLADGLQTEKVLDAVVRSSHTGATVEVE